MNADPTRAADLKPAPANVVGSEGRYAIKCDGCRSTIGRTDEARSRVGGRCYECNPWTHVPAGLEVVVRNRTFGATVEATIHKADDYHPIAGPFRAPTHAFARADAEQYAKLQGWKVVGFD